MSAADKKNVVETWGKAYTNWDGKDGVTFYTRLFEHNPKIKAAFSNPDFNRQSVTFGNMIQSWVANLDDASVLDSKVGGMCASHKNRGITDLSLFRAVLDELAGYLKDLLEMTDAQQASWQEITDVIINIMKTKF